MTGTAASRSLKEKQRAERETLILQVAEEMLTEKGFHDTSMEEIAQRVGIAKGTIYLHFASKEDLIFTLLKRYAQEFLEGMDQIFALALGPRAKLEAILRAICGSTKRLQWLIALRQNSEMQRIFEERHALWHQAGDETHESFHHIGEQFVAQVRALFEAGKTAGEFDATLPTAVMLSAFFGAAVSMLSYQRFLGDTPLSQEAYTEYLVRMYFKGIAAQ